MYQVFAHTADVGLRIKATELNSVFAEAGIALFSLIVSDLRDIEVRIEHEFHVEGHDLDFLLLDWLHELLFTFETQRLLFREFQVSVHASGLDAKAWGELFDEHRHRLDHEVKAITYHGLRLERMSGGWLAEVIVDI
jgi:SHS2 domain-containing protein